MGYTIYGKVDTLEELEKLKNNNTQIPEFTIKEVPFSWNDNFSEIALEDFSMIQKKLSYGTCQSIGMALAKLKLLEEQGCKVEDKEDDYDDKMIRATRKSSITKQDLLDIFAEKGLVAVYNLGLKSMLDYLNGK